MTKPNILRNLPVVPHFPRWRSVLAATVAIATALPAVNGQILDDWQFNDGPNLSLDQVQNSAGSGFWNMNIDDSFTTAQGTYRISRAIPNNQTAHALWNPGNHPVVWLVVDIDGWAFSTVQGGLNEEAYFGFSNNVASSPEVYAGISLRRAHPNKMFITGISDSRINGGATWIAPVRTGLTNVENRPLRLVLKLDRSAPNAADHTYSVYFNLEEAGYVYVGTGKVDPNRSPSFLYMRALNSFADLRTIGDTNTREFLDVNRVFITADDPIGTNLIPHLPHEEPEPQIVNDWQFNEANGTLLRGTTDTVGGATWVAYAAEDPADFHSNNQVLDGAFRVRRPASGRSDMFAYIDRIWAGKQWLVVDFRGWHLNGAASEELVFGFMDTHQVNPSPYAEFRLRRWTTGAAGFPAHIVTPDPEAWYLAGRTFGLSNGAEHIDDQPVFPRIQNTPTRIVLEVDEDEKTYAIFYLDAQGEYRLLDRAPTDPTQGPNAVRFRILNDFASDIDGVTEFVDIERIFVTTDNPMLPPVAGEGYATWAEGNFPGGGTEAAPGADPDGDGIPNILEYAFGGNPNIADRSILPSVSVSETHLEIAFTRNSEATDLTYTVEASSDLATWTPIASAAAGGAFVAGTSAGVQVEAGDGVDLVKVLDSEPKTAARRFLRVIVSADD